MGKKEERRLDPGHEKDYAISIFHSRLSFYLLKNVSIDFSCTIILNRISRYWIELNL